MGLKKNNPALARWELFLSMFRKGLLQVDQARPTIRYWRASQLTQLIKRITTSNKTELRTNFPSGKVVLERLEKLGWIKPVSVEWTKTRRSLLYHVDLETLEDGPIDPLELLQGYEPEGVICYLGALQYHELTTQFPAFYHIAKFRSGSVPKATSNTSSSEGNNKPSRIVSPLGTELFTNGGLKYYETTRYRQMMPGVQLRVLSGRNSLRITDYEQTLLDTLQHPLHCGGITIVFEAWERAAERIDLLRLLQHLKSIDQAPLWRRTASMLRLSSIGTGSEPLTKIQEKAHAVLLSEANAESIPLLPGFHFPNVDSNWRVNVPAT